MAGDGWHGQDAYGNDMEYEGGRYARGAGPKLQGKRGLN